MKRLPTIQRKTLLYKSDVEYADYCINHVEGCSHGCRFPCYAMMLKKRFGRIKTYCDWIQPKLVSNTQELLDKELPRLKGKIHAVHLCFTTDPFMYKQPEITDASLKIIERLNKEKIKCVVLTKGLYPKELVDDKKYSKKNEYGITLISLDRKFKENFEPGAAPYVSRIKSLKYLSDNGYKTWISMEPYPTPNIVNQDLREILNSVKFVEKIIFGKLNYNVKSTQFNESNEFYEECSKIVKDFCKKNNIKYHIKYGTRKKDNKKTSKILLND